MSLASRIFQGTVIVGLVGTVATEFLKSATATVTAREIGELYGRARPPRSAPVPPAAAVVPLANPAPTTVPAAAPDSPPTSVLATTPAPLAGASAAVPAPLDEDELLRLLAAGEFNPALAQTRASPALTSLLPGCELLVRFGRLRDAGDFVSARRTLGRVGAVSPRLEAVAAIWNCRLARLQKHLPDLGQCLAEAPPRGFRVGPMKVSQPEVHPKPAVPRSRP